MIKAIFSNGYEDIYKGKRDVKAAWMITKEDGSVYASGHSLDLEKARKTAGSNLPRVHNFYKGRNGVWTRQELAKKWGISHQHVVKRADAENAAYQAKFKIEVVAL